MAPRSIERPVFARELADMFRAHSEDEIRALMRQERHHLPFVPCGRFMKVYPTVYAAYLAFLQKVVPYAEVEQAARRVSVGTLQ